MKGLLEDKRFAYLLIVVGIVAAVLAIVIDPLRDYELYLGFVRKPAPPRR